MRKFDTNGLLLAEYQGKIFEKSYDLECSTPIFMRRFFHSKLLDSLEENSCAFVSLDVNEAMDSILEQFGPSKYGKEKYSKSALFWIGYLYRYIAYTREEETRFIAKIFDYKLLNNVYYSYHTQSLEWCISSLLDIKNLDEDIFDKNKRLKKAILKQYDEGKYLPFVPRDNK